MALTVIVRSGDLATPASITFDAPRIVLGRGEGCEVLLPDPSVSHRHASIRQRGTDYVVFDEGSSNGTFVGPVRLSPQAPRVLRSGDLIRLGRVWVEVRIEQVPVTQSQKLVTREIALNLVASALAAQGEASRARVWVQKGPTPNAEIELEASDRRYVVGRGAGIDLSLEDPDLSRRQLEILRRGTAIVVRDLGSKNGSFLGGERLPSGKEVPWPAGVVLSVGTTELVHEDRVAQALAELESGQDERLRDDEPIDPPTGVPAPSTPAAGPRDPVAASPGSSAPIAAVPRGGRVRSGRRSLGLVDLIVAIAALTVLGLSLFGLWVLTR